MSSSQSESKFIKQAFQVTLIIAGLALTVLLLYFARYVVIASLIGIGLGVLASPLLTKMREKFQIPRALSVLICLLVLALFGTLVFYVLGFLVTDQLEMLSKKAPEIIQNLEDKWRSLYQKNPGFEDYVKGLDIESNIKSGASHLIKGVSSGFALVSGLVFAIVIAAYTSVGSKEYLDSLVEVFPSSKRKEAKRILIKAAQTIRKWFRAQLIDMIIIGALTLVGLWIIGVDYWAVFGLLTAVSD